jgi:hypothetical protein
LSGSLNVLPSRASAVALLGSVVAALGAAGCDDNDRPASIVRAEGGATADGARGEAGALPGDAGGPSGDAGTGAVDTAAPDARVPDAAADLPSPDTNVPDVTVDMRPMVPMTPVAAAWTGSDIGVIGMPGSSGATNNALWVRGAGNDIWASADAFHFLAREVSGDVEIVARLVGPENTNADAKAGLMFRESLDPGAKNVFLHAFPAMGKGMRMQYRDLRVDAITHFVDLDGTLRDVPVWLRLVRRGNQFTGYVSADGVTWVRDGVATVAMPAKALVGVAVTSHNVNNPNVCSFESVRITNLAPGATPATSLVHAEVGSAGGLAIGAAARLTIDGAGRGIGGQADGATFVHQEEQVIGDAEVTVKIASLAGAAAARAGIAMRSSLAAGARMVFFGVNPSGGLVHTARTSDNGNTSNQNPPPRDAGAPADAAAAAPEAGVAPTDAAAAPPDAGTGADAAPPPFAPIWLKLVREGNRFVGFTSSDGTTWSLWADRLDANISDNVYVGVAVTGGGPSALSSVVVESFSIVAPPQLMLQRRPDAAAPPDSAADAMAAMPADAASVDAVVTPADAATADDAAAATD